MSEVRKLLPLAGNSEIDSGGYRTDG
jgi:hypothetical protein